MTQRGRRGNGGKPPFEPMTRQDQNEAFLLTSFLYGGNADYIEELYARFIADPASVDESWASFFRSLKDAPDDVSKNAEGPSWRRRDWPRPVNGELVSAFDGNYGALALNAGKAAVARAEAEDRPVTTEAIMQAAR